jgi:hypothetical protein
MLLFLHFSWITNIIKRRIKELAWEYEALAENRKKALIRQAGFPQLKHLQDLSREDLTLCRNRINYPMGRDDRSAPAGDLIKILR